MGKRGRPKNNPTSYKEGDVIMFLRDVKKDSYGAGGQAWTSLAEKKTVIPKNVPVTLKQINKSHVWVEYKGETHWLRFIADRMIPATEAAQVLFAEKK